MIFVLFICFFIFLFSTFLLARDDFVLVRKDVTTEKVFNIAFMMFAISILSARILYTISNPSSNFLSPLVFLLFPYFPGLSLAGGVGGGVLFLLILSRLQKLPTGRVFDIFSISVLSSLPFGILGYFLLSGDNIFSPRPIALFLIYIAMFIFFLKFFLPKMLSRRFKDGTVGFLFLTFFSVVFLVDNAVGRENKLNFFIEDLILILLLYTSLVFLFRQEKVFRKIRKYLFRHLTTTRGRVK